MLALLFRIVTSTMLAAPADDMHMPPPEPPLLQPMLPRAAEPESNILCHVSGSWLTNCKRSSTPPAAASAAASAALFGAAVLDS
jgi:hypothetical protein